MLQTKHKRVYLKSAAHRLLGLGLVLVLMCTITSANRLPYLYAQTIQTLCGALFSRLANRPGMTGIIPELTVGVPCPGRGSFCPGNVKLTTGHGYMAVH